MDILAKKLDLAARQRTYNLHPKCLNPIVTHLSFADDVLIFFDGTESYLSGILQILYGFYGNSCLSMNLSKSCLFLDGNNLLLSRSLAASFGLIQGSLPIRYLGVPLLPHKMRKQDFQPLIDKIPSRLNSWTVRHLSFAGRLQLIQSVLYSIINFWASVFMLPVSCLKELERICNAFYGVVHLIQLRVQRYLGFLSVPQNRKVVLASGDYLTVTQFLV